MTIARRFPEARTNRLMTFGHCNNIADAESDGISRCILQRLGSIGLSKRSSPGLASESGGCKSPRCLLRYSLVIMVMVVGAVTSGGGYSREACDVLSALSALAWQ